MSPMDRKNYHPNWEAISAAVKEAAGQKCELCNARGGFLHWYTGWAVRLTVHHIDGNPKNNSRANLIALCERCHLRLDRGLRSRKKAQPDLTWPGGLT